MQPQKSPSGYLLYCIYNRKGQSPVEGLTGVQEQTVETVSAKGLYGAVSALTGEVPKVEIAELKRYGHVVAACHQAYATIPMRYGSIFTDKPGIAAHLEEQSRTYLSLLLKLTDCEEMGIRLLLPGTQTALFTNRKPICKQEDNSPAAQQSPCSGQAYLTRQKERYGLADTFLQRAEKALLHWQGLFKGLYRDCCWERPETVACHKAPILSAYFLVRRQYVADFEKAFVRISRDRPEKALLSGPWPPYNFTRPKQASSRLLPQKQEFRIERDRP